MPESDQYDVIVIGGGHNGLATAALLAKAQQRVLVLERRNVLGGAAATEPVFPGCQVNTGGLDAGLFLPQLVSELNLETHGLRFLESPALTCALFPGGRALTIWRDVARTAIEIARFSQPDAQKYPEFARLVARLAGVLAEIMVLPPPSLPDLRPGELLPWLRPALQARRLGQQDMMALLRVLPMPVTDFLDEWFESPQVKAALGAPAMIGSLQGPRAPGTAFMFLYNAVNAGVGAVRSSRFVAGGAGALSAALAHTAIARGAEVCAGQAVDHILIDDGRATGVQLAGGKTLRSRVVVSSADPKHTFFDLVGAPELEVRFVRDVRAIRMQASAARVNLALKDLPRFTAAATREPLSGHIQVCPDLDDLEHAYDDAKYGAFSRQPFLDIVIPTLLDPGLSSAGGHLMNITVQYTPYRLKDGPWETSRQALANTVLDSLTAYAPDLPKLVTGVQVVTPLDLEQEYGLTGGDIYHGQMGLDQLLFMRPVAGYGRYAAPIDGLYLCGAGTHPGGGLTGAPGYNAAYEILRTCD